MEVKWLDTPGGDTKNGMFCRVFSGEGQVAMAMGKKCRETTAENGCFVRISQYLVIAFSARAGILPVLFKGFAVFPAGVQL